MRCSRRNKFYRVAVLLKFLEKPIGSENLKQQQESIGSNSFLGDMIALLLDIFVFGEPPGKSSVYGNW